MVGLISTREMEFSHRLCEKDSNFFFVVNIYLFIKSSNIFCLKPKTSISTVTGLIEFSLLLKLHIGIGMVLGYFYISALGWF